MCVLTADVFVVLKKIVSSGFPLHTLHFKEITPVMTLVLQHLGVCTQPVE